MTGRLWYDHKGGVFEAPVSARTCYDTTGKWRTHILFGTGQSTTIQAITLCGRRAGAIPGSGAVDCPECQEVS